MPRRSSLKDAPPPLPVQSGSPPLCFSSATAAGVPSAAYHDPSPLCQSESYSCSDDPVDAENLDPAELNTLEDYIIEDNVFDACVDQIVVELKDIIEALKAGPSYGRSTTKRHIERKSVEAQECLASAISEWTRHDRKRTAALSRFRFSNLQKSIAKSKHNGKGKVKVSVMADEQNNNIEAKIMTKHEHSWMELQLQIASEELKSAELAYLAAKENNKTKMLDFYNELLVADTSVMTEDIKVERLKALECMRKRLFDNKD